MARKLLKKFMPDSRKIKGNKYLKIFGRFLNNPNLWHLNRNSVATGVSLGLFCAYLPFPGHMLTVTLLAIAFQANLPIALALVWVSNPFTIPPQFYFAYKLGAWILQQPPKPFHFEISFHWLINELHSVALPLLVGSLICGIILAIIGNIVIRLLWRYSVIKAWTLRRKVRIKKKPYSSVK